MTREQALGYVDRIGDIPTVRCLSVSGGEPFLFPELLGEIISVASAKGLFTECVTNCFWATSEKTALAGLRPLKDAGLDMLNLSADDFHQAHLPFSQVYNAYWAARCLDFKLFIMCTVGNSSKLTLKRVIDGLGDNGIQIPGASASSGQPTAALAVQSGFLPAGRASSLPERELKMNDSPLQGPCLMVLRDLSISPDGTVHPCCSSGGLIKGVELGNVNHDDLQQMVRRAGEMELFATLFEEGPETLARRAALPVETDKYVNKCHLCQNALRQIIYKF